MTCSHAKLAQSAFQSNSLRKQANSTARTGQSIPTSVCVVARRAADGRLGGPAPLDDEGGTMSLSCVWQRQVSPYFVI
ncbi:hypothetical protein ABTN76_19770, partial [Acinetobacter baumannii]